TGALDLLFEQGKRMFDAFQYDQAVPLFDQLIATMATSGQQGREDLLVQTYEMRARARFALGNTTGAEQDFAALLGVRPDFRLGAGISPRVVAILEGVRQLTIGQLVISSTPPGEIQVGDRVFTVPGEAVVIDLVAGTHRLTVDRQGFGPVDQSITITAGAETEVALALERVSATLSIITVPAGVSVVLDGTPRGETPAGSTSIGVSSPLVLTDVPLGQHRLELRRDCYAELSLPMNVTQDIETEPIELMRAVATVRLDSRAADAMVFVDGVSQGPLRERSTLSVCEGRRVIEVRGADGRFVDRRDWRRGATETLQAELKSAFPIVAATGSAAMPVEQLREAVEQALSAAPELLVYAPVQSELEAVLQKNNAPANWLGGRQGGTVGPALPREAVRDLGQRIAADLGAQGLSAVGVGTEPYQAEVLLLASGSGDPDRLVVNTADPASQRRVAEAIGAPLPPIVRPSLELSTVDVAGVSGAVVVRASGAAAAAGYAAGDAIVGLAGQPVVSVADVRAAVAALDASTPVTVDVRNAAGETRAVPTSATMVIDTIPLRDPALLYNRALIELRQRAATATAAADRAATHLNLGVVHLRLGNWDDALAAFGQVQLPEGAGVSAGTVQYLRGLCLESAGRLSEARTAFAAAAEAAEARISTEGPLVAPLARAKLATLR
ncbi:MAG TPA: PEGA domain-containing protein, partial [Vicinamibacterales bacterium]|nr:PEGA domain-containing protein [Vicinamibacterales bacterium]